MIAFIQIVLRSLADLVDLAVLATRPCWSLEGEDLVLRRQLGLFNQGRSRLPLPTGDVTLSRQPSAPRKWLDTHMKNCFTRRGGDSERRNR
jgi:hypothetical protein